MIEVEQAGMTVKTANAAYVFKTTEGNCQPITGYIAYGEYTMGESTLKGFSLVGFGEETLQTLVQI
ncbi:hypothetical protein [Thaumasiovibrio subtropicus]|uniref:hypothetical protein n=1 Tax=Thaumasiovibrio subtropicus TaxID=1891207 RepID=UPI000B34FE68|nr:hypothetical protein [Thaumasiovibrio subtropicus]